MIREWFSLLSRNFCTVLLKSFQNTEIPVQSVVSLINLYASSTFLVVLSFDRYLCLVYPVRSRYYRTMKNAVVGQVLCWVAVLAICIIQIQFRQLIIRMKVPGMIPQVSHSEWAIFYRTPFDLQPTLNALLKS